MPKKDVSCDFGGPKKIKIFFLFPRKFPPIERDGQETYTAGIPHGFSIYYPSLKSVPWWLHIFFFDFMPKNRPFFRFSDFLALWPPPKFWVMEVRVQIQFNRIQVGPKLFATIFPWMDPASPFLQLEKTWKKGTENWKVVSSSRGSNPDPLQAGCSFGRYSNPGNTYIVGF